MVLKAVLIIAFLIAAADAEGLLNPPASNFFVNGVTIGPFGMLFHVNANGTPIG